MAFSVFLDANVILDHTLKRDGYINTRPLLQQVIDGHLNAFTSPSIVHIVGYWLTKSYGSAKAREIILTLLTNVRVLELNHDITILTLHSKIIDIEDALQYYTALHHKVDSFISCDKKLKTLASTTLPVLTPEELLRRIG